MKYYLGIDGGGTKTAFILVNENLDLVNYCELGTCYYPKIGFNGLQSLMEKGIKILINDTIKKADIKAYACMSGYGDVEENKATFREAVTKGLGIETNFYSDAVNALFGSLAGKSGINIIAGTGCIAMGVDDFGNYAYAGGWHYLFSDEGSGYWLALKLLEEFSKQSDKRHKRTYLYKYLKGKLALEYDTDLNLLVEDSYHLDRSKIAKLSLFYNDLLKAQDEATLNICSRAVKEYIESIIAVKKDLKLENCLVSYSGGVFKNRYFVKMLKENLPKEFIFTEPVFDPLIGTIVLALKEKGIGLDNKIINKLQKLQNYLLNNK